MRRSPAQRSLSDLTRFIVEHIVDDPEAVTVSDTTEDGETIIVVEVADEDRGAVIGRQGRTIRAIEQVVRAAAGDGPMPVIEVADG
jgi:predicted RNA-binding protein YlqC (UPF0109 family)